MKGKRPIPRGQLEIIRVPDPERPPAKRGVSGQRTGMGIRQLFYRLFEFNEECHPSKRLTNESIKLTVLKEFPDHKSLLRNIEKSQRVNWWRNLYNRGKLLKTQNGIPPKKISLRYNYLGEPVDWRTGTRKLSLEEIRALCRKYGINDPRFMETENG